MTTPTSSNVQALLQRAAAQAQANRYAFLRKAADNKLIAKIANS